MLALLRRYFISGLLVWIPIWVTLLVIHFILSLLNNAYIALPKRFQLDTYLGFHVPGIGVVVTLLIIFITGMIVANFLGKRLVALWDGIVGKIPLVRSVHAGVRQVLQSIFTPGGKSFRKVLLLQYPRKGLWTIAFQTGTGGEEVNHCMGAEEVVTVFVPTTPNPTSGFLMMARKEDVVELDMSVDEAFKFVISLGVVHPRRVLGKSPLVDKSQP
jgi:uncharacterized membrane protein